MGRHQILAWLLCTVIPLGLSNDSDLQQACRNVYANYTTLENEMLTFKSQIISEVKQLANATFTRLQQREVERLKDGFSSRDQEWMTMLRERIGILMVKGYPGPCYKRLFKAVHRIDKKIMKGDTEVKSVFIGLGTGKNISTLCTENFELDKLREKIVQLTKYWGFYKNYHYPREWRGMVRCYVNVSAAVEKRLTELSLQARADESMTEEHFFSRNGLLFFRLPGFIAPILSAFNDSRIPSDGSSLEQLYHDLHEEYGIIQGEIVKLKKKFISERNRLGNITFAELQARELKRLEDALPDFFYNWMSRMIGEIGPRMIEEYPTRCEKIFKKGLHEIDVKKKEGEEEIGEVMKGIMDCIKGPKACTSYFELSNLREKISQYRRRWLAYKKNDFILTWVKTCHCYAVVSSAIEDRLWTLSKEVTKYQNMNYEQFKDHFGLLPSTLHKFLRFDLYSFEDDELSSAEWETIKKYRNKSELMRLSNFVQTTKLKNVRRRMASEIDSVVVSSINNTVALLTRFLNEQTPPEGNQSCYRDAVPRLVAIINDYYRDDLLRLCFQGFVEAYNEFTKIDECDLPRFKERLSGIRECWTNLSNCDEISSRLDSLLNSLESWEKFDPATTMENARSCYINAQTFIYTSITLSVRRMKECEIINLPNLNTTISTPEQRYPDYERSAFCSVKMIHPNLTRPYESL